MFGSIGMPEMIIILVIALIIFGPRKLPELGRSLGSGMREFKHSIAGEAGGERATLAAVHEPEPEAHPTSAAEPAAVQPAFREPTADQAAADSGPPAAA